MKYKAYIISLVVLIFVSCRKDVKLKLPEYKQKLVVEASIETGSPAYVLLSTSVPYFGTFDFTTPENAFVKGAFVTVSDGTNIDTLKELDPTIGYIYLGSKVIGQVGKTYTLKINWANKEHLVQSTILAPVALDSLFFKWEQDSLGFIWQKLHEPPGLGNNYRWFAKRLNTKYKDLLFAAPPFSVFDDKFVDGKAFDFSYDRGPQPNNVQAWREDPNRSFFRVGDTVAVKFCQIGKSEYDFWNTYYLNKASNSNPFSAPVNIQSMFGYSTEVFGAFTAYSPTFDTIIIKKKP